MKLRHKIFKRGFTLIELMVVIAIIGVLSSIVLASLNSSRMKSRDTKRIADIKGLQTALEFYFDAKRRYPEELDADDFVGEFIPSEPTDPIKDSTGNAVRYKYATDSNGEYYHLGAALEDTSNAILKSDEDRDCNSANSTSNDSCYTGWNAAGGFAGDDSSKNSCAIFNVSYSGPCFDVTPY